jgi:hypothetical protein
MRIDTFPRLKRQHDEYGIRTDLESRLTATPLTRPASPALN